ncbi:cor protein [Cronobacter dublinensis]|uniref:phage exclusion lipoprotein Cor n=1 Tax=Cronobacter dublinensis TaxID=413497 RepID=UPI0024AFE45D|nr:cor protein [Cronobacter dublinensis]MDI7491670.1 cor protein [Cronobacter dublinensis]
MKKLTIVLCAFFLAACSGIEKQTPVCTATAIIGGKESSINIYGVRKMSERKEFKAGYPFNWRWVSKSNFTSSTCE